MRKALWLAAGVTAVSAAAFFMGAAAAMTGAPVFYDARFPQTVAPAADDYDVDPGPQPGRTGGPVEVVEAGDEVERAGEAEAGGGATPTPPPEATVPPAPSPTTPPASAPGHDGRQGDPGAPGAQSPQDGIGTANPTLGEQREWLAFQQLVRECMADEGQEYLYWEWWNPGPDGSNRFPAMPADLTPDEYLAWELALHGTSSGGDDYRWQDAGCWGEVVHRTGGTN